MKDKTRNRDVRELIKSESRQLPIIDDVNVDSTWYALRMTPLGMYDHTELEKFIKTFTQTYIFVREVSSKDKEHYHCVINSNLDEFEIRLLVRAFLLDKFGKGKRGDANKQYNLSTCDDVILSITYILKDGGTIYQNNFDNDKLEKFAKNSYKKFDKEEFAVKLKEIKDFVKSEPSMKIAEIMERIVKLKAMYRQPINMNYIYQLSLSLYLHNRPNDALEYVEFFLLRNGK